MQIILLEKVANLGQLGDIVKVKDGFARNYLIPKGKAKRATPANVAEFEQRRTDLEKAQTDVLAAAQERAGKLEGLMVQVAQKAGVDGRLFGSVTNFDIAEALKAQGFEVPEGAGAAAARPAQARGRVRHRAGPARRREGDHQGVSAGRAVIWVWGLGDLGASDRAGGRELLAVIACAYVSDDEKRGASAPLFFSMSPRE